MGQNGCRVRLLSIKLFGEYKGLKDQAFDFSVAGGDVAVLIGMNGSGKSQVMELIAEVLPVGDGLGYAVKR